VAWATAIVVLPAPLPARIMLVAPLVVIPQLLGVLPARRWIHQAGPWAALVAAVPLVVAYWLPAGPATGVLAVPWLALSAVAGAAGLADAVARLRQGRVLSAVPELGVDAALGFWAVGAASVVIDRLALPAPFPPVIVLLTATHFHLAGTGLVAIAALLAMSRPPVATPVLGLMAGIPVTALGFVLPSAAVGALGAALVGSSGIGVALALLAAGGPPVTRLARRAAGMALLVGMPLGIGWSVAGLLGIGFLDLDAMVRTHGILNAFAVVAAVATWTREPSALPARDRLRVDPAGGRRPAAAPAPLHGVPKRAGSSSAGIDGARPRTRSATRRADAGPVEIPHGP
jgi:hypothetical protein